MRYTLIPIFGFLLATEGSFVQRYVPSTQQLSSNNDLLANVVMDEYPKQIDTGGKHFQDTSSRRLDDGNNVKYYYYKYDDDDDDDQAKGEEYENNDDYYVNENSFLNLDGYSLKYAKCQPVQRFSQNAVEAGEYSPMVINDIVILRLCPSLYCSDNRMYGCNSDFVEYAIELTDYIRIMLRYEMDKKEQLCSYCQKCAGNQRRAAQNYYYYYDNDGNAVQNENYAQEDDGDDDAAANECGDDYEAYCLDEYGNLVCNEDDNDDDSSYMAPDDYLEIIDCIQVNGGYFIQPRCDAYSETLSLGIYNDEFCSNQAYDVDIEDFNLGINQSYFQEFGNDAGCIECSESDVPPYLTSNSNLCNRMDVDSARCTSHTHSELFISNDTNTSLASDQTDCSFIESVRFGTYDADGQIYFNNIFGANNREVTDTQKWLLAISLAICTLLAVYSCYLHHAITNLLIKSLSHTDLLPPSRFRQPISSGSRRRGSRSRKPVEDDADEEGNS